MAPRLCLRAKLANLAEILDSVDREDINLYLTLPEKNHQACPLPLVGQFSFRVISTGDSPMALTLDGESLCHPPFGRVEPRRGEGCNAVGIRKTARKRPLPGC